MLQPYHTQGVVEAGCDEAGRGCLAGPVVAAAVVLPQDYSNGQLHDSKKLTAKARESLALEIKSAAIAYAIGLCDHEEIDAINILNASILAMHKALDQLTSPPEHILVDGNRFKAYREIPHVCIVKGDGKYQSIAAASILAKTYRDNLMAQYAVQYPQYDWHRNMGYPTAAHRKGIMQHGISPLHRRSFQLVPMQLELFIRPK